MASQFQNRLVGISILVACVVLFLPTIIDGKKTAYEDEFVATPIHPEIKPHTQSLSEAVVVEEKPTVSVSSPIEPAKEVQPTEEKWQVQEIATTVTIEKEQTTPPVTNEVEINKTKVNKEQSLAKNAWTIQLGAFQSAANINALLKTLHKAGFQAHTVPKEVIDGELTRVFVGPDVSKSKLEKQLARLKQLTQLEGKLYPFDAVNP